MKRRASDLRGGKQLPRRSSRILVVDDDQVDRRAVLRHLRKTGVPMEVAEAEGVLEAIERLAGDPVDCVLLDFNLPDGDGLTFLRGLRAAGLSVPVIMLTGQSDPAVAAELVAAGASDYISKSSLSPERLLQSLRTVLPIGKGGTAH